MSVYSNTYKDEEEYLRDLTSEYKGDDESYYKPLINTKLCATCQYYRDVTIRKRIGVLLKAKSCGLSCDEIHVVKSPDHHKVEMIQICTCENSNKYLTEIDDNDECIQYEGWS